MIINDYGHQKMRTIDLHELDRTTIYFVCKGFLPESHKQSTSLISFPFWTLLIPSIYFV